MNRGRLQCPHCKGTSCTALDSRALLALARVTDSECCRLEAIQLAFELGHEEASWPPGQQVHPSGLIAAEPELLNSWCAGVQDAWTLELEEEAEASGCDCCAEGSYLCSNHRADPQHAIEAKELMQAWRLCIQSRGVTQYRALGSPSIVTAA